MKKRIENELQNDSILNIKKYKKYQMFYLKKMNYNFKNASKSDGFRFLRNSIVHDIGFCHDEISKNDLLDIAQEHIAATEFGFDNNTLGKYSTAMTAAKDKKAFYKGLRSFHSETTESKEKEVSTNRIHDDNGR